MMATTSDTRARALAELHKRLSPADAVDLEHTLWCLSQNSGRSYKREVFTALHNLDTGGLGALVAEFGGMSAMAAPDALISGGPNICELRVVAAEAKREETVEKLREIVQNDCADTSSGTGLRCRACQSTNLSYNLLQTRSADEGTTIFVTCFRCGKRWKM